MGGVRRRREVGEHGVPGASAERDPEGTVRAMRVVEGIPRKRNGEVDYEGARADAGGRGSGGKTRRQGVWWRSRWRGSGNRYREWSEWE